jgi:hypothetical protein
MAAKAANSFETMLRNVLEYYLALCCIDYGGMLQEDFDNKSIDQLTMGQVVQALEKVDRQITKCCLRSLPEAETVLAHPRLIKPILKDLRRVTKLRNRLHHQLDVFTDEPEFVRNVGALLAGIRSLAASAVFDLVVLASGRQQDRLD